VPNGVSAADPARTAQAGEWPGGSRPGHSAVVTSTACGCAWAARCGPRSTWTAPPSPARSAEGRTRACSSSARTPADPGRRGPAVGGGLAAQGAGLRGPHAHPGLSASAAVHVDYCPACGYGTGPWHLVTGDGAALAREGNVGDLNQPVAASFLWPGPASTAATPAGRAVTGASSPPATAGGAGGSPTPSRRDPAGP